MKAIRAVGAAFAVLLSFTFSEAAPSAAQQCLAAKEKALAKYESCVWKVHAKGVIKDIFADSSLCRTKFDDAWAKADTKFGSDCPNATVETIKAMFDDYLASVLAEIEPEPGQCSAHDQDCPDGLACYPGGADQTVCAPPGTTPEGGACTAPNDCMEGFVCVNSGMAMQCREICRPSSPACSTPSTSCVSLSGFEDTGVCL
ncbi:MAG: hypothetical protein ABR538_01000 [Candidatus Binatia bacterium]